jgi:hypothetical protein
MSLITHSYFGTQKTILKNYGFTTERLLSSSHSVQETQQNIRIALSKTKLKGRKAFFITHSLGGLALLEELVRHEDLQDLVGGIVFMQSPFYGTPIADVFLENPYYLFNALGPVLPFLNTSEETIRYLSTEKRSSFMEKNQERVERLQTKIPLITLSGVSSGPKSLFAPATNLIEFGCINVIFSKCISETLYDGPYDQSDGMVPFKSSLIDGVDFVRLEKTDHGETVVSIPFENYEKKRMTETLLRLMLKKF